jgi:phospholipid/cholesterol/gamma-HCH transport system substrate-binding protein
MIFGKTKVELKVGIFVFLGLVILAIFILSIGSFKTWTSGRTVNFVFHFVNGVKLGAPVRYAGVDVGEVKSMSLLPLDTEGRIQVKVGCWVKKELKVPLDSTIWVNTLGLMGEKYIEIIPGKDFINVLADNQELVGMDPISMQEVTELANKIVRDADDVILKIKNKEGTIGKLLGDDGIYNELDSLIKDVVAKIKNKEGTIGKLLGDDQIYNDLDALIKDIRKHPWKLFWKTKEKKE